MWHIVYRKSGIMWCRVVTWGPSWLTLGRSLRNWHDSTQLNWLWLLNFCTKVALFTGRQRFLFLCAVVIAVIYSRSAYCLYWILKIMCEMYVVTFGEDRHKSAIFCDIFVWFYVYHSKFGRLQDLQLLSFSLCTPCSRWYIFNAGTSILLTNQCSADVWHYSS